MSAANAANVTIIMINEAILPIELFSVFFNTDGSILLF
jgi:hypothetical protein